MIQNERQYKITKAWAERFEREAVVIKSSCRARKGIDPDLIKLEVQALEYQAQELRDQMREWETKIAL